MPLVLICSKCGGEMNISDEMLEEARETGKPFSVVHDVCPKDVEPSNYRNFKVLIQVYEIHRTVDDEDENDIEESMELLGQFGEETSASTFEASLPKLLSGLQHGWDQVAKMAPFIDAPDPSPKPDSAPVDGADAP